MGIFALLIVLVAVVLLVVMLGLVGMVVFVAMVVLVAVVDLVAMVDLVAIVEEVEEVALHMEEQFLDYRLVHDIHPLDNNNKIYHNQICNSHYY